MYYTISETAEKLQISKDALRYYDRLNLVTPQRSEGKYRKYSEADVLDLMYLQALKYGGFTLAESKRVLKNKKGSIENKWDTISLLKEKKQEMKQKMEYLEKMMDLVDISISLLEGMEDCSKEDMNRLVRDIFESIKEGE